MNMEIASAISANSDIKVTTSMFGLFEKAIYLPTNSKLKAFSADYTVADGNQLAEIMSKPFEDMKQYADRHGVVGSVAIGNVRVEACMSEDGLFVMYQWFRFVDFQYQPITPAICYTGDDVNIVRRLLSL